MYFVSIDLPNIKSQNRLTGQVKIIISLLEFMKKSTHILTNTCKFHETSIID